VPRNQNQRGALAILGARFMCLSALRPRRQSRWRHAGVVAASWASGSWYKRRKPRLGVERFEGEIEIARVAQRCVTA